MAAGSFVLYDSAKEAIIDSTFNLETAGDTIVAALVLSGYTPASTHSTWNDAVAQVVLDGDYAPQVVAGQAVTEAGGTVTFDANDVSFGDPVTITAKYIILIKRVGGTLATSDPLIGYMNLDTGGGSVSSTNAQFQVNWNASGIFTST
jgi:hypothetical protein